MNNFAPLWQALMAQQQMPQQQMPAQAPRLNDSESPEAMELRRQEMMRRLNSGALRQVGPDDARMVPDRNTFMPEDVMTYRNLLPFGQERL